MHQFQRLRAPLHGARFRVLSVILCYFNAKIWSFQIFAVTLQKNWSEKGKLYGKQTTGNRRANSFAFYSI